MSENNSTLFNEFPPISLEEWEAQIKEDLKGKDYREKIVWEPISEFPIYPFYRRKDIESLDQLQADPGAPPYLRGTTRAGNPWKIRELIAAGDLQKANQQLRRAVDMGVESVELPIQPRPNDGMLGGDLKGIPVQSQQDLSTLLEGVDLENTSLYFDTGISSPAYLAMLANYSGSTTDPSNQGAYYSYDPFSYIASHGRYPCDPSVFMHYARQMVEYCRQNLPEVKPLCIDLSPYHYGGASNMQQIGAALSVMQEYLARISDLDTTPEQIARNLHFSVPVGSSYFLEIAKLRAIRMLWSRILEEYLTDSASIPAPVIHTSTSSWTYTAYDAHTNIVRATSQAMSAVIGGCESLAVTPHDIVFRQPTRFSRRIARNIQHLMREESHFEKVADPAGGSYYIETLTDELARHAWEYFQEIEKQGGFLQAVEGGFIPQTINQSRQKRQEAVAEGQTTFIGINNFPNADERIYEKKESVFSVASLTQSDKEATIDNEDPISSMMKAFSEGVTVGDIIGTWFNPSHQQFQTVHPGRGPQPFEKLRLETEEHEQSTGERPRILLIPMGQPARRKQRANFVSNLLGCGGYELIEPLGFEDADTALQHVNKEQPDMVVLCGPDGEYPTMVKQLLPRLNEQPDLRATAIAGYPSEHVESFRQQGVDYFIHLGSNRLELLQSLHRLFGITSEQTTTVAK